MGRWHQDLSGEEVARFARQQKLRAGRSAGDLGLAALSNDATQLVAKKMRTLGMRAEPKQSGAHKRMNEWDTSPDSAKKCRVLDAHPSGESL